MIRVVLDTNILISAIHFGGTPRKILDAAIRGEFETYTSEVLIQELLQVLHVGFEFPKNQLVAVRKRVRSSFHVVTPKSSISACRDDADNRVLECAVAANASYIVTGDKDLLTLETFHRIEIIKPADFYSQRPW